MQAVVATNVDLPPGWSLHRDQNGSWYYANTNTVPPQITYDHPAGGHSPPWTATTSFSSQTPNVNAPLQMSKVQQLYLSTLNSASGASSTSPPPSVALQTPSGGYTSPTGIMTVSPPGSESQLYQQYQQPGSPPTPNQQGARASVSYVPAQPMSVSVNTGYFQPTIYAQPLPQQAESFFGVPKHTATAFNPGVPNSGSSYTPGYHTAHTPLPPQNQTTYKPLITEDTARKTKEALKIAGKVAWRVGGVALQFTTGIPPGAVEKAATTIVNRENLMRLRNFFISKNSNSLGVAQSDLLAVLQGAPDANYGAVIQALMKQQQLQQHRQQQLLLLHQQQRQGAAPVPATALPPTPPVIDYAALITELQRIQAQAALLAAQGQASLPLGQVGVTGQAGLAGQIGSTGQVQANNVLLQGPQNELVALDRRQELGTTGMGTQNQQALLHMQLMQQQQAQMQEAQLYGSQTLLATQQQQFGLNQPQPVPGLLAQTQFARQR